MNENKLVTTEIPKTLNRLILLVDQIYDVVKEENTALKLMVVTEKSIKYEISKKK